MRRGYRRPREEAETLLGQDNYSYSNQRLGWGWDKSSVMRQQTFHLGPGIQIQKRRSPKWQQSYKGKESPMRQQEKVPRGTRKERPLKVGRKERPLKVGTK